MDRAHRADFPLAVRDPDAGFWHDPDANFCRSPAAGFPATRPPVFAASRSCLLRVQRMKEKEPGWSSGMCKKKGDRLRWPATRESAARESARIKENIK